MEKEQRDFNGPWRGDFLNHVSMPMGGMGAGMICLESSGSCTNVSLHGRPQVGHEPNIFAALAIKGQDATAKVLEGPVPERKILGIPNAGNGAHGYKPYGYPRCTEREFESQFPFGTVRMGHRDLPFSIELTGWSPFTPGDADSSSLPMVALEYTFRNTSDNAQEAVFSFHASNFMARPEGEQSVAQTDRGFVLRQTGTEKIPWFEGAFSAVVDDPETRVDCRWFRGGWFDPQTLVWKNIEAAEPVSNPPYESGDPSPGASLYVPFSLDPGAEKTLRVLLGWHVPQTDIRAGFELDEESCTGEGGCCTNKKDLHEKDRYVPWYVSKYDDIKAVMKDWQNRCGELRRRSALFAECFQDTTLPPEVTEAVGMNLSILKSPTTLRQTDGRLWLYEGCCDGHGCCDGSCTHVWNYAQAICHLFPEMERSLRQTEFHENQDQRGHQNFRAALPIREVSHAFHAAADGQLGGIMKVFRDWRICGDTEWLRGLWPLIRKSLDYCIETWDPDHLGVLREPHHNTYDIEFWGPDGMCTSFYLGALFAGRKMAEALGEDIPLYVELYEKGRAAMESDLYDGEYFIQKVEWKNLRAEDPTKVPAFHTTYSEEARELMDLEGPKYQYGSGCLSDGVLGAWIARCCGLGAIIDPEKEKSHVASIHRYNLWRDLTSHVNPQRPTYALGNEGGLLTCSWPKGGELTLPFVYSNEVWTGIEYQVAAHCIMMGLVDEGLEIVRIARQRYDGRARNPFNEFECGHWYGRAQASYGLLQALSGARYDAVEKTLFVEPRIPGDFRAFLCTATGYGTVGVRDGKAFLDVREGTIDVESIAFTPCE